MEYIAMHHVINHRTILPNMPILGSSKSAANKDMMSKIWTIGDSIPDWVENIVGKEEIAR